MSTLFLLMLLQGGDSTLTARMGVRVFPDTVTVGDRFTVTVRVKAPAGMKVEFPVGPDTTGGAAAPIQLMSPRADRVSPTDPDEFTATYTLTAWDVGDLAAGIPDVRVLSSARTGFLDLSQTRIHVRSVLPTDSSLRVPKPPRAVMPFPVRSWWPLIVLALTIALAALVWYLWKRYRDRMRAPVDPYEAAIEEFARIEALDLPGKGEPERHVALMTGIMRQYLGDRIPEARLSYTTFELHRAFGTLSATDSSIIPLLEEADVVKFARGRTPVARAREVGMAARAAVESMEKQIQQALRKAAA